MYLNIFRVVFLLNYLCFAARLSVDKKRIDVFSHVKEAQKLRAPFFELPCMHIGGICAKPFACPPGTKVMQRSLCPQQQRLGMECCKPYMAEKKCSTKDGFCAPKQYTCPTFITNDITDCLPTEICCIIRH